MKRVFLLILLCLICGCNGNFFSNLSKDERYVNAIRSNAAKKIQNELGLIPFGSGGQMMYEIEKLKLVFQCRHLIDIEEGRNLLLQASNIFLNEINSHEKVRPYLKNYPFEPKNISVWIVIMNPDGTNVDSGNLSIITLDDGILSYDMHPSPTSQLTTIHEEAYGEALQKNGMTLNY